MAQCKYGGPNCVHNNPHPGFPSAGGATFPTTTDDPDCQQYSSCGFGSKGNWGDPAAARRRPPGSLPLRSGTPLPLSVAHLKAR
jgi:hypothetical protein